MNYQITNLTNENIDEKELESVINKVSEILDVSDSIVSIVLTDNKNIHEINKTYRGIDRETDVISFAFMDEGTNPNNGITDLGEIYIKRDLCFLLTHGLLHLLGYDHMNKDDEKEMFSLQEKVLSSLGIER